jgi:polyisoprenoid-binding protein YceI
MIFCGCQPAPDGADGADGANGTNATDTSAATGGENSSTEPAGTNAASDPAGGSGIALTPENTAITFVGTKDDGKHDGGFKALTGSLDVSGDTVAAVSVTAQTNSLWADNPKLERHLKHRDFFEVEAHPELSFVSKRIEPASGGEATHTIAGDLTMLDQTHPIEVPATIEVSPDKVHLKSNFTIDRTQWGMDYRPEQVHKDVQISVTIDAARQP